MANLVEIDRLATETRLEREIATLATHPYSRDAKAVTRYAFVEPYMRAT